MLGGAARAVGCTGIDQGGGACLGLRQKRGVDLGPLGGKGRECGSVHCVGCLCGGCTLRGNRRRVECRVPSLLRFLSLLRFISPLFFISPAPGSWCPPPSHPPPPKLSAVPENRFTFSPSPPPAPPAPPPGPRLRHVPGPLHVRALRTHTGLSGFAPWVGGGCCAQRRFIWIGLSGGCWCAALGFMLQ